MNNLTELKKKRAKLDVEIKQIENQNDIIDRFNKTDLNKLNSLIQKLFKTKKEKINLDLNIKIDLLYSAPSHDWETCNDHEIIFSYPNIHDVNIKISQKMVI